MLNENRSRFEPLIKTALQDQNLWSNNMKVLDLSNNLHSLIITYHPEERDQYSDTSKLTKIEKTIHNLKSVNGTNSFIEDQDSAIIWSVTFIT